MTQVGANATGYSDTDLSVGTASTYRVRAFSGGANTGYSNEAIASTYN